MTLTLSIIFLVFGLIIGSFLNVVIFRFNTGKSFGGRSKCLHCHKTLSWHELIPVFSFLFLKGRCSECRGRISFQYPLVELVTGLIFSGLFLKFQNIFYADTLVFSISYAYYALMFSFLIVIATYDNKHKIIPDVLVLFLGIFAFAGLFLFSGNLWSPHIPYAGEFLRGILFALPFGLIWIVSRGAWMGLGDANLALSLGWLLSVTEMLSALTIAFWSGALIGLILVAVKKMSGLKSEIPFAPFLVFGAIVAFIFGINIFPFGF